MTAASECGRRAPAESCDPVGSYGLRISVDAAWNGRAEGLAALTDNGRGVIQIYLLANVTRADPRTETVTVTGRVCGTILPPFYSSALCETYRPKFPDATWESSKLPKLALDGRYSCGAQGCVMSLNPITYLFGLHLDNPEARWPSADETSGLRCPGLPNDECFTDDDDDGVPGVRVDVRGQGDTGIVISGQCNYGYNVQAVPLSASVGAIFGGARRSDRLSLGIRTRVGSSFRLAPDCQTGSGAASAYYVSSRARSCQVEPGSFDFMQPYAQPAGTNDTCSAAEAHFIDQSLPDYRVLSAGDTPESSVSLSDLSPSPGPLVRAVRFAPSADAVSCERVRAAAYD